MGSEPVFGAGLGGLRGEGGRRLQEASGSRSTEGFLASADFLTAEGVGGTIVSGREGRR